ncbi:PLP-dependent aminotransferase family protein [Pseudomonas sp. Marseille-P8916]|uniref:aminotransferase-like domain-containing protein n=1 Tax=Pseudomonas sp. Marseille-P8916 TaxID=2866589 RepID=UPI001CE448E1|nr:PLP-dependent aminotransferase family protein [Pseudomonas sp. Marseille-P8916]
MGRSVRGEFAYQAVYRYLEALIAQVDPDGDGRLPSLRDLAQRLRVSLATVQSAYGLLEHEGRVRSVPKSGYFVRFGSRDTGVTLPRPQARPLFALPMPSPPPLERALLAQERRLSRQAARRGAGDALLRNALAARYTRSSGHYWSAEHVHLGSDVQALLETVLLALRLRGATALVAAPCCWRLLQALQRAGMRVIEVPLEAGGGLDLDSLARLLDREPVRLVVMPSCLGMPLGHLMPVGDQQAIAALLAQHPAWLLENDLDSEHCYDGPPASRLRDLAAPRRLLVLGALEATVGAEAPYAYVLCRHAGVGEACARRGFLLPPLRQQALAHLYARGDIDACLPALRAALRAGMERLCQRVEAYLGDQLTFAMPQGGWALWVCLRYPADLQHVQEAVAGTALLVVSGRSFSLQGRYRQHLLLIWQGECRDALDRALRALGGALAQAPRPAS